MSHWLIARGPRCATRSRRGEIWRPRPTMRRLPWRADTAVARYPPRSRRTSSRRGLECPRSVFAIAIVRGLAGLHDLARLRHLGWRHIPRHFLQFRFCPGIAAPRGKAEPHEGARRTLRHALPLAIHRPDHALRLRVARFGQRPEQPDRRHIVAAII